MTKKQKAWITTMGIFMASGFTVIALHLIFVQYVYISVSQHDYVAATTEDDWFIRLEKVSDISGHPCGAVCYYYTTDTPKIIGAMKTETENLIEQYSKKHPNVIKSYSVKCGLTMTVELNTYKDTDLLVSEDFINKLEFHIDTYNTFLRGNNDSLYRFVDSYIDSNYLVESSIKINKV